MSRPTLHDWRACCLGCYWKAHTAAYQHEDVITRMNVFESVNHAEHLKCEQLLAQCSWWDRFYIWLCRR